MTARRWKHGLVVCLGMTPAAPWAQPSAGPLDAVSATPATTSVLEATTGSLRTTPEFYRVERDETPTTIMLSSTVEGETSATDSMVTTGTAAHEEESSRPVTVEQTTAPAQTRKAAESAARRASLPVKVDNSSTAAQALQLAQFERHNQMGEAFLLACQMVRNDPASEFAYDAAIRTSLVLGLDQATEDFYRQAIRNTELPGKYVVQLAHFYSRRGMEQKLRDLLDQYEKSALQAPDYWLTLARLATVAGDADRTTRVIERARQAQPLVFPLTILLSRAYAATRQDDKAREVLIAGAEADYGPWEKRAILQEFLKLRGLEPSEVNQMLIAVLVNETDYDRARGLAEVIMDRAVSQRIFHPLQNRLAQRIAAGEATDIEIWLAALMAQREGDNDLAIAWLTSATRSLTPVLAQERALAFAATGRHDDAARLLSELVAEQPTQASLRLLLAEQYLALNRPEEAHRTLAPTPLERLTPDEQRRLCEMSIRAVCGIRDAEAIADRWMELAAHATFGDLQAMGDEVLRWLRGEELLRELSDVINRRIQEKDEWPLLLLQARLCSLAGDHALEIEVYARYLDRDWNNISMAKFVAELATQYADIPLHLTAGKDAQPVRIQATSTAGTDIAIRLYRRLIELQPRVTDNYSGLMRLYQMRGEVETAKKVAVELADSNTSSAEVQAMAASVLFDNGFAADAIPFFVRSLKLDNKDFDVWFRYAAALGAAGRTADAEVVYKKFLEHGVYGQPYNQPAILAALLKLATETRQIPQLVEYLQSLTRREIPGLAEFYISVSKLMMQVRADDRAQALLEEFPKRFPDHPLVPDSFLLLGQLHYSRRDFPRALEVFRLTAARFEGTQAEITATFNIGEVERQQGQPRQAIETWLNLARSYPDDDRALAGIYEAAAVAADDIKDLNYAAQLLSDFLNSGTHDFPLLRKARSALSRLQTGGSFHEAGSGQ
jgi:tetratricopeptide (TPR) repeat protein